MKVRAILVGSSLGLLASAASAGQGSSAGQPPLIQTLASCRSLTNDVARLRCYDSAASALTGAVAQGDVVLLDQEAMRTTRRSLFGFHVPKLPLLLGDRSADDQREEITTKVIGVRQLPHGFWQMKIEEGALWETTEASTMIRGPRPGDTVRIKGGALGSYMIRIAGQRALKARRVG